MDFSPSIETWQILCSFKLAKNRPNPIFLKKLWIKKWESSPTKHQTKENNSKESPSHGDPDEGLENH